MNLCIAQWLPRTLALTALAVFTPLVQAQNAAPANAASPAATVPAAPASVTAEESSYSVGLVFGNQLRGAGLEQVLSVDAVIRGLKDALAGKALTPEDKDHALQLVRSGRDALATRNHASARDYLAQNAKAPGVTTTSSGETSMPRVPRLSVPFRMAMLPTPKTWMTGAPSVSSMKPLRSMSTSGAPTAMTGTPLPDALMFRVTTYRPGALMMVGQV